MRGLQGDPTDPAHSSQDWKEPGGCFRLKEERGMTITVKSQRFIPGPAVFVTQERPGTRAGKLLAPGSYFHRQNTERPGTPGPLPSLLTLLHHGFMKAYSNTQ